MDLIGRSVTYVAAKTADGWGCEWRIPPSVLGPRPQSVRKLLFNVGVLEPVIGQWVVWVGTDAEIHRVDRGGVIVLEKP